MCFLVCIAAQHMTLEDNIQELRNAMAGIGRRNSEKSGGFEFFTVDQAKAIINYLKIRYLSYMFIVKKHSVMHLTKCTQCSDVIDASYE